jgi:hypothetical protein
MAIFNSHVKLPEGNETTSFFYGLFHPFMVNMGMVMDGLLLF